MCSFPSTSKTSGCSTNTSSLISPFRNVDFISKWYKHFFDLSPCKPLVQRHLPHQYQVVALTFGNNPCFVFQNISINLEFGLVYPLQLNKLLLCWSIHQLPFLIACNWAHLLSHCNLPFFKLDSFLIRDWVNYTQNKRIVLYMSLSWRFLHGGVSSFDTSPSASGIYWSSSIIAVGCAKTSWSANKCVPLTWFESIATSASWSAGNGSSHACTIVLSATLL